MHLRKYILKKALTNIFNKSFIQMNTIQSVSSIIIEFYAPIYFLSISKYDTGYPIFSRNIVVAEFLHLKHSTKCATIIN